MKKMTEENKTMENFTENYKTIPCVYFEKHKKCNNDDKCSYAHGKKELKENNPKYKTSMCPNIENKGKCPYPSLHC